MVETILITGATGMVGGEVIRQLVSINLEVNIKIAGHSLQRLEKIIEDDRIKSTQIDFNKPETLREALKSTDKVFLLTPFQLDMIQHSSNMLAEIKNAGNIKHIVKLSVIGADFEPGGRLHRQVEKMIEDSGIAYTFLRPNAFMQNFVISILIQLRSKVFFPYQLEMVKSALLMLAILQQLQFKRLLTIMMTSIIVKHTILQGQKDFLMMMLSIFCLSKWVRK